MCPDAAADQARRKALGAWYTPDALVDHVVALTLAAGSRAGRRTTVVDPACGDGRFLAAIARRLGDDVELTGVDIDEAAVHAARTAIPHAEIVHGDALALDWGDRRFDVVIGNPPFLNQLASATSRGGASRFGGGPYANTAAEFLALAAHLARPGGGRVGLVLPQSMLTTRDAAPIRDLVLIDAAVVHAWWSDTFMFDAVVRTCAIVLERGVGAGDVSRTNGPSFTPIAPARWTGSWGALLLHEPALLPTGSDRCLGDIATFNVDFRDQYYGLIGAVGDDVDGPPLVTSGLIEPGRCLWGERPVKFAKQRFEAPRVELSKLTPKLQAWAGRRLVPKLLIANQTRVIEAVDDPGGAWLPSVPVITCTTADPAARQRVLDVLGGDDALGWVRHHGAGSGLAAGTVRLSPALLASIPLPP